MYDFPAFFGRKMNPKEAIRPIIILGGVTLTLIVSSKDAPLDLDSIRLASSNTIGPTPDMVVARLNPDVRLTPTLTPTPVPTIGSTPTERPTDVPTSTSYSGGVTLRPPTIIRERQSQIPQPVEIVEGQNYQWAERLLFLTNELRKDKGKPPYQTDPRLKASAEKYAEYSYRYGDPYHPDHNLDGSPTDRAIRQGYFGGVWENMDASFNSPDETFSEFVASPGHYAALLLDVPDIGIGCFQGKYNYYGAYYRIVQCVMDMGKEVILPTSVPTPDSTPEPLPTATVGPMPSPTPVPTVTPTPEPTRTPTPEATPTSEPTPTLQP
ncbi:hypothetical protein A2W15_06170 [Candidatus Woesebacteria bacterium RBG_16_41_13]|nr:MAG: hypothetical protein A2W15_06170 [Candidatus Woesebacteria bacterium RBG_16_41_13]